MVEFVEKLQEVWSDYGKPAGAIGLTLLGIEKIVEYVLPFAQTILENVL